MLVYMCSYTNRYTFVEFLSCQCQRVFVCSFFCLIFSVTLPMLLLLYFCFLFTEHLACSVTCYNTVTSYDCVGVTSPVLNNYRSSLSYFWTELWQWQTIVMHITRLKTKTKLQRLHLNCFLGCLWVLLP